MQDKELTASLNYEAEYHKLREQLAKAKMENEALRDELQHYGKRLAWYDGIKQTLEVIYGRDFPYA